MTEQELAKWAGFKQLPLGKKGYHFGIGGKKIMNWLYPGDIETWQARDHVPYFTDSSDACFDFLWPKVREKLNNNELRCYDFLNRWISDVAMSPNERPAALFCKHVERFIEEQGNS